MEERGQRLPHDLAVAEPVLGEQRAELEELLHVAPPRGAVPHAAHLRARRASQNVQCVMAKIDVVAMLMMSHACADARSTNVAVSPETNTCSGLTSQCSTCVNRRCEQEV